MLGRSHAESQVTLGYKSYISDALTRGRNLPQGPMALGDSFKIRLRISWGDVTFEQVSD